jgi:hypothetical protein
MKLLVILNLVTLALMWYKINIIDPVNEEQKKSKK